MTVFAKKKCPACNKDFSPKSDKNQYCRRSCFKKAYYHRKKAQEKNDKRRPTFTCPICDQRIILPFDPVKKPGKWLTYKCPGCCTLMISVCENIVTQDTSAL